MEANWIPGSDESKEKSDECEVDKIISDKKLKGGRNYYVKWKGFSNAFNQWVPEADLDCQKKVAAYHKEKRLKKVTQKIIDEDLREEVVAVQRQGQECVLLFSVKNLRTGKVDLINNDEMKSRHLSTLLRFYESNIEFTEKEIIPRINILPY